MKPIKCLGLAFAVVMVAPEALAQAVEEDYSRGDLFILGRTLSPTVQDYSLPSRFEFPKDAREGSIFGVDYSHHNCECVIDWASISASKVQFAYLKASQGKSYKDPWFVANASAAAKEKLQIGGYHFFTATHTPTEQAKNFLGAIGGSSLHLVPSIDLEWDLGPMTAECPTDAQVKLVTSKGDVQRCDRWSSVSASEIISRVNTWIEQVGTATGQKPILYTNGAWWAARIGKPERIKEINTDLVWIADYSSGAQATEKPRVPNNALWHAWQFTDRAKVSGKAGALLMDASILQGGMDSLKTQYERTP